MFLNYLGPFDSLTGCDRMMHSRIKNPGMSHHRINHPTHPLFGEARLIMKVNGRDNGRIEGRKVVPYTYPNNF